MVERFAESATNLVVLNQTSVFTGRLYRLVGGKIPRRPAGVREALQKETWHRIRDRRPLRNPLAGW